MTHRAPSSTLTRAMSYSPSSANKLINHNHPQNNSYKREKVFSRNNTFKATAPHIICQPKISNGSGVNYHKKSNTLSTASLRPIRSGAFQRIDNQKINKY
mmetsp:Transcript_6069/g.6832  ORF Transcript_6069/g.6832 Transcript_6069/m.6832 type:complete len:100 (+) Transcript_6069:1001-1300(+)